MPVCADVQLCSHQSSPIATGGSSPFSPKRIGAPLRAYTLSDIPQMAPLARWSRQVGGSDWVVASPGRAGGSGG
eukprot:7664375-Alexandrium_andersonii.AAC.1